MNPSGQLTEKIVRELLNRFTSMHEGMSAIRVNFIKSQNALVELNEKESELDDLGDGYRVFDYENLKMEVQTISSNIDVKQEQLESLRQCYNREKLQHDSAEQKHGQMLKLIEQQLARYEALRVEEKLMRGNVNELKAQKSEMKEKHSELKQKSGILTRKPLMKNFDEVAEEIQELEKEVAEVEVASEKLSTKSKKLEATVKELEMKDYGLKHLDTLIAREQPPMTSQKKVHNLKTL